MDGFVKFLDEKLSQPMARLSTQRHLRAIRDGIVATLPLIIVGSFFLILGNPPLPQKWGIYKFLTENAPLIVLPFRMSMAIMSLYATFGIGLSLAESYDLDGLSGGIISTMAFLMTITPVAVEDVGFVIPMGNLGGGGMFVAIVTAILAVEIFRLSDKSGLKIKMPDAVPPSVARSFEALVPTAAVMLIIGSITYWVGFDWHTFISKLVQPLVNATDSLPSVLLLVTLNSFFWSFGIHGASIVGSIARPIWVVLLEANQAAVDAGTALPHIAPEPFLQWFVYIGGSGATIGLALSMLFFARSSYAKSLGKAVIGPSLFNINEPVIFGAPVVLNPILVIPFIITPGVLATIAWFATKWGLVNRVYFLAPWTLPGPIGAYLATGGDFRAAILNVILILISLAIYYPFFRIYDNNLLEEERQEA
ncbi:MAG TPA: PTS sugar transporter subunit IIC [Erysipelothrix sp.]|nr:PTS sugar transporter subunit IIC [Erysipelothrix sp.]